MHTNYLLSVMNSFDVDIGYPITTALSKKPKIIRWLFFIQVDGYTNQRLNAHELVQNEFYRIHFG